jgi:hypothetical protein
MRSQLHFRRLLRCFSCHSWGTSIHRYTSLTILSTPIIFRLSTQPLSTRSQTHTPLKKILPSLPSSPLPHTNTHTHTHTHPLHTHTPTPGRPPRSDLRYMDQGSDILHPRPFGSIPEGARRSLPSGAEPPLLRCQGTPSSAQLIHFDTFYVFF